MRQKQYRAFEPRRCWVGETPKIIYPTREEAELAAKVAEYEHHLSGLSIYHCDYGDHWHITSRQPQSKQGEADLDV